MRRKLYFLPWLLAATIVAETIASSCWIFQLNAQIAKLEQQIKQQIETLQQRNIIRTIGNEEQADVQR
jgi:hypothetical protein